MFQKMVEKVSSHTVLIASVLTSLIVGALLGVSIYTWLNASEPRFTEVRSHGEYEFISPLLECENVDLTYSAEISKLRDAIDEKISALTAYGGKAKFISYYFRDLNNGPWIGVNENEPHSPASLIKIPLAITIYKQAERNPEILTTKLLNKEQENTAEQNIKPEQILAANTEYTIEDLIKFMLVYSSNGAFDLLREYMNQQYPTESQQIYKDLGIDFDQSVQINPNGNIISVREYASFFRILYNSSYLTKESSNHILSYLNQSTYQAGINPGVPAEIPIAHKYGERYFLENKQRQLHDCGIVYAPHSPYLICVMTRGDDLEELKQVINELSRTTYDLFINQ